MKLEFPDYAIPYHRSTPGARRQVAYIRGFEIAHGAIAQTIAHDCHNIIAVGSDDDMIVDMVNRVISMRGGIAATDGKQTVELPLPIGGILSNLSSDELKDMAQIEHSGHRSVTGFTVNLMAGLAAFSFFPKKPMIDLDRVSPCENGLIQLSLF